MNEREPFQIKRNSLRSIEIGNDLNLVLNKNKSIKERTVLGDQTLVFDEIMV